MASTKACDSFIFVFKLPPTPAHTEVCRNGGKLPPVGCQIILLLHPYTPLDGWGDEGALLTGRGGKFGWSEPGERNRYGWSWGLYCQRAFIEHTFGASAALKEPGMAKEQNTLAVFLYWDIQSSSNPVGYISCSNIIFKSKRLGLVKWIENEKYWAYFH